MDIDGACHCGFITYEATVDPERAVICHCTDCQILSGTAFRTAIPAPAETFRILTGKPKIYLKEPLINCARARRRLCARSGLALASVVGLFPMSEPKTGRSARKGPSRKGLAVNAASRSERSPALASATVTLPVLTDLPHLRLKRPPRIINQRFLDNRFCKQG